MTWNMVYVVNKLFKGDVMKQNLRFRTAAIVCGLMLLLLIAACGENNTTEPTDNLSISQDAAESIASNLAYATGGTTDQLMDLSTFATAGGFDSLQEKYPGTYFTIQKTYDEAQGRWNIHIERERGSVGNIPYAFVSRDYILQYLNAENQAQRYYISTGDTARTIHFQVVQGQGSHITRRLSQQLNELNADWTLTNAHLDVVTVNGTYYRAAVDTIRTFLRMRTSDHNLQLNVANLSLPRGSSPSLINAISGTVTGHFHADVTFTSGTSYSEGVIDRDINIVIGEGKANIGIAGKTYRSDLLIGELEP